MFFVLSNKYSYAFQASDDDTVIPHPVSLTEPVMFSYRGKGNLFVKKTVRQQLAMKQIKCIRSGYNIENSICELGYRVVSSRGYVLVILPSVHASPYPLY